MPAISCVNGSDRSVFTGSQRRWVSLIRSLGSTMLTGTLNRMSVMRLPPIGSSALRMLTGMVTRNSSTWSPCSLVVEAQPGRDAGEEGVVVRRARGVRGGQHARSGNCSTS